MKLNSLRLYAFLFLCSYFLWIPCSALAASVLSYNPAEVQKALKQGANVNSVGEGGQTPLLNALTPEEGPISYGFVEMLLKAGANPNVESEYGMVPLATAATAGDLSIVNLLLKAGANVTGTNKMGSTALHSAASLKKSSIVEMLLKLGANVNAATRQGRTPLMAAVWSSVTDPDTVVLMIAAGADVNTQDSINGDTPLHLAAAAPTNTPRIISLLVRAGADPTVKNMKGETAFDVAKQAKKPQRIQALIQKGGNTSAAALNKTIPAMNTPYELWENGTVAEILNAIKNGADVNQLYYGTDTPLSLYLRKNTFGISVFQSIVDAGADINLKNNKESSLLALHTNNDVIAEALIKAGADVHAKNNIGYPVITYAAASGSAKVVNMLLDAGAKINESGQGGRTPLTIALQRVKQDADHMNRPEMAADYPIALEVVETLKRRGAK